MRKSIILGIIGALLLSINPITHETSFAAPTASTLKQKLAAYQTKQKQVEKLQKQISAIDEDISNNFHNIAKIQNKQVETKNRINQIIVHYYTSGQNNLGAQLLGSNSVSEFIFHLELIRLTVERDRKVLAEYHQQAKKAKQEKAELNQKLADLKPLLQKTAQQTKQLKTQYQSLETELKKEQEKAKSKQQAQKTKQQTTQKTTKPIDLTDEKQQVQKVVNTSWLNKARAMIGTVQYQFGASNYPYFDCSSWVQYIFRTYRGIELPRTSGTQANEGTPVSKSELQPGDLVFFQGTYKSGISHVGIYLGNSKYISNRNARMDLQIDSINDSYSKKHWWGARRVN